jgi:KTSC domain
MNETAARSPHLILRSFIRIQENMQRVSVDSSSIASIGYAREQQVLELEFRQSGEVYQYFDVTADEHTAFLAAESKGTYLNLHFKPQHRYHRVWPQEK